MSFTASITGTGSPTGSVEFRASGTIIPGCEAVTVTGSAAGCTTRTLSPGVRSIVATYSGDGTNDASTSPALTQSVRYVYRIVVEGAQETPPEVTNGWGTASITVDVLTNELAYDIRFANLSSPELAAHIHGMSARNVPTGVLHTLPAGSPKIGTWNFSEAQEADILAGLTYVNIHSNTHGGGEIRGQIDNAGPLVARTGDLTRDGRPDLIFRHAPTGSTFLWAMDGTTLDHDQLITPGDPAWHLIGVADFNRDGHNDLVWRNESSGQTIVWYMNAGAFASDAFLFGIDPVWKIEAIADFNRDGYPDFLFRHQTSGVGFIWYFQDTVAGADQYLFGISNNWIVEAVGDFNNDGYPDFFFRNTDPASGLGFVWLWNGTSLGADYAMFGIDPAWQVVQIADWNRDGFVDFVFRNVNTGVVFVWYTNGTALQGSDFITQIDPSWQIAPHP